MQQETIREAVAVFNDIHSLNEAVAELEVTAFPRHSISVLDGGKEPQPVSINVTSEEDDPDTPRTILIRPEEKSIGVGVMIGGGFYAGAVTGILIAGIGASFVTIATIGTLGGIFGAVLGAFGAWLLGHYYNDVLKEQIRTGRMILWVRTPEFRQEQLACDIMRKHGGQHVHIHEIQ